MPLNQLSEHNLHHICFLAARKVGPEGKVIGVDMTPEMIEKSRANAAKAGYKNVEFRLGEIEKLPVDDSTIDLIISSCVINLVPDKEKAFRVLRPGGSPGACEGIRHTARGS